MKPKWEFALPLPQSPGPHLGKGAFRASKQIFHSINNQLTIVIGKAALPASKTNDLGTRQQCEEIGAAAQKISQLLNEMAAGQ